MFLMCEIVNVKFYGHISSLFANKPLYSHMYISNNMSSVAADLPFYASNCCILRQIFNEKELNFKNFDNYSETFAYLALNFIQKFLKGSRI